MPIHRLNHAVLYVRDVDVSVDFYTSVLGFREVMRLGDKAAFLQAADSTNDHDLGLFALGASVGDSGAGRSTVGLYHLAWEVTTLADLQVMSDRLSAAGSLVGSTDHSVTKSLYAKDPDGIEFEVEWIVPTDLITDQMLADAVAFAPLDIASEIERWGLHTKSASLAKDEIDS